MILDNVHNPNYDANHPNCPYDDDTADFEIDYDDEIENQQSYFSSHGYLL